MRIVATPSERATLLAQETDQNWYTPYRTKALSRIKYLQYKNPADRVTRGQALRVLLDMVVGELPVDPIIKIEAFTQPVVPVTTVVVPVQSPIVITPPIPVIVEKPQQPLPSSEGLDFLAGLSF
jgi:hypothetical protein